MRVRVVVLAVAGLVACAAAVIGILYWRDMASARSRLSLARYVQTPHGKVQYAETGTGPAVLVLHGAGGGFDQGLLIARLVVGDGYRAIAPSRFGYLGTPLPADASLDAQADAYAELLDSLGVAGPVHVVAFSAGGPSGLSFAARHPERVRDLVMLSAVSHTEGAVIEGKRRLGTINGLISGDFVYWAVNKTLQPLLVELLGVPRRVQASFDLETRREMELVMDLMNPMSSRLPGTLFDQQRNIDEGLARRVKVPTLVIHDQDDGLVSVRHGEHTHASIPGSRLVTYPTGGHMLSGRMAAAQQVVRGLLSSSGT